MPSKFGEFRYLGGKPGVKTRVTFQAQVKNTQGQWSATTNQISCQGSGEWIGEGYPIIAKDLGSWNAQNWNTSAHKRVLVQITEDHNGDGQADASLGTFLTQDDGHNQDVIGASVVIIGNSLRYGYVMPTATTTVQEMVSDLVNWGQAGCQWLANP